MRRALRNALMDDRRRRTQLTRRVVPALAPSWLTGYLNGNGVVDAVAAAAMDAIDVTGETWSWIAVCGPPASSSYCCGSATGERVLVIPTGSGAIYQYLGAGFGGRAFGLGAPPPALFGVVAEVERNGNGTGRARWVLPDGSNSVGEEDTYATSGIGGAAYLGSGDSLAVQPYTGRLYAVVALLVAPTAAEVAALLGGAAPWEVWTPSDIARAWNMGEATEDKGTVTIPDSAATNGGPFAAANAVLRNGNLSNVVVL